MSPDERARRGITPPSAGSGERAAVAAADTPAHPESVTQPAAESAGRADLIGLPVDDGGRYEMAGVHARGGLGRVVKARDRRLHRTVAVKELLQRTPSAEARFVREALITARLQHPGIVPVHDAGRWPSGDPYYSMKLVSGRTLKEMIQARDTLDERVALVPHVLAVAEAIAYAHSQRVIHRDIKPANVIVGDFGETVVVDWGLAKDLTGDLPELAEEAAGGAGARLPGATADGNVMGTPSYMSPEQARGEDLDTRADVYSLGAMLYEVLAGEPPHTGATAAEILESALAGAPRPLEERQPGAPPDLCAIVRKAMARRPEDRYPSAAPLAEDIRRFQTGQLVTARHYSTRTLVRRWIARHRSLVAVAGAAAVALLVTGGWAIQRVVGERNRARAEQAAAERAEREARLRSHELVFLQALSSLGRDPTAALAWLKDYPAGGPHAEEIPDLIDEAMASGVARHVLRHPGWVMGAHYAGEGRAVSVDIAGGVYEWDLETGAGRKIAQHQDGVWATEMSPDGSLIALGGQSGLIGVVPADGSGPVRVLGGQEEPSGREPMIETLVFSAGGGRLLAAGVGDARVWDLESGEQLVDAGDDVFAAALTPDGRTALVAVRSGEIVRIAVDGGKRRTLARFPQPSVRLLVSPDGRLLFSSGTDGKNRLIEISSGRVRELGEHESRMGGAAFSPSGDRLATGGSDTTVRIYDVASGREEVLRGHRDSVYQVAFSPDGSLLASASDDGTARLWHLRTGQVDVLRGHDDDVYRAVLRPDAREIITASLDGSVRVWPLEERGRLLSGGPAGPEIWGVRFAEGDRVLLALGRDRELVRWDLATGEVSREEFMPEGRLVRAPVAADDGHVVATALRGGGCRLFDRRSGKEHDLTGHRGEIRALAMAGDGRTMVTADEHGLVQLWDVRPGGDRPAARELFRDRPVVGAALTRDGGRLVLGDKERIAVYELPGGAEIAALDLAGAGARGHVPADVRFSVDGEIIVSPALSGASLVWHMKTGAVHRLDSGSHHISSAELSPDSRYLAAALGDRTIRLMDTATGETRTLAGHTDLVMRVAFSADSRLLASASYDRTVRLWDARTGETVRVLRGHHASVDAIALSQDGRTLASFDRDGTVRLWDLDELAARDRVPVPARLSAATTAIIQSGRAASPTSIAR